MDATRDPTQPDSSGLAAFAAGLVRRLAEANADGNLVFSPLSIYAALALLAAGARGATLDEILRVVGARSRGELEAFVSRVAEDALKDHSGSGGPRVAFASGIWSDLTCPPLKPAFRQAVMGAYKAEASIVDFSNDPEAARVQINAWVEQVTRNLIRSFFRPGMIKPSTRVVLGNAMYFKGSWDNPFDKKYTAKKLFYRLDGGTVDVPFMQRWDRQYIAVHDGFKVLKLQYKMQDDPLDGLGQYYYSRHGALDLDAHSRYGLSYTSGHPYFSNLTPPGTAATYDAHFDRNKCTQFSMCIFLPDASDGLPSLVETIASQPGFMHEHLPKEMIDVGQFRLPKFKLSFQGSIVTILQKLGLQLPFSGHADLSDMVDGGESDFPMVVNEVIHKAVIEVNEEGTEAAAATFITMVEGCCAIKPPSRPRVDFVADHPFAYFIVEEVTGAVVFAGHVLDPSKEN